MLNNFTLHRDRVDALSGRVSDVPASRVRERVGKEGGRGMAGD